MKPFRPPHQRFLGDLESDELDTAGLTYRRIDSNQDVRKWKRIRSRRWRRLSTALDPDQKRLALRYDDAQNSFQTAQQDASFDAGYAFGVLAAERAAPITPRERSLVDTLRRAVIESGLGRRSCLRALLAVTEGLVTDGHVAA